ncbi:MAG: hypothetical protein AAGC60_16910 [Acidobacteriota bacterium]
MRVRLPVLVQDPSTAAASGLELFEHVTVEAERFLDGPATERVVIEPWLGEDGEPVPPVPYRPPIPRPGRRRAPKGSYRVGSLADPTADDVHRVSVLGTVLHTVALFEEPDVLGRRVLWPFDGPLRVVPRAGWGDNARYAREHRGIRFQHFRSRHPQAPTPAPVIYTSLSHDVIAHETTHAVLDAVAPDLYHAVSPQSIALHEAIADLAAFLLATRSRTLRSATLRATEGSIRDARAFSWIAEEFGRARDAEGRASSLRSLANDKTLDPDDASVDAQGRPNSLAAIAHRPADAHTVSLVLSGALYGMMLAGYEATLRAEMERTGRTSLSASGRALFIAGERIKRIALRGLDYLPPGEILFVDFARALLAADTLAHPLDDAERESFIAELVRRRVVVDRDELALELATGDDEAVPGFVVDDIDALRDEDDDARAFVEAHRERLGAPPDATLEVRPRLEVNKTYWPGPEPTTRRELLVKVAWRTREHNDDLPGVAAWREIVAGATLVVDPERAAVRAVLVSRAGGGGAIAPPDVDTGAAARSEALRHLAAAGRLVEVPADGLAAASPSDVVYEHVVGTNGDTLRVLGAARLLHAAPEGEAVDRTAISS